MPEQTIGGATYSDYVPFDIGSIEIADTTIWYVATRFGGRHHLTEIRRTDEGTGQSWYTAGASVQAPTLGEARELFADSRNPLVSRFRTTAGLERVVHGEPVGQKEIAARLGVDEATVQKWRTRGVLPEPEPTTVGGRPWWRWNVVEQWAVETGRLPRI